MPPQSNSALIAEVPIGLLAHDETESPGLVGGTVLWQDWIFLDLESPSNQSLPISAVAVSNHKLSPKSESLLIMLSVICLRQTMRVLRLCFLTPTRTHGMTILARDRQAGK